MRKYFTLYALMQLRVVSNRSMRTETPFQSSITRIRNIPILFNVLSEYTALSLRLSQFSVIALISHYFLSQAPLSEKLSIELYFF